VGAGRGNVKPLIAAGAVLESVGEREGRGGCVVLVFIGGDMFGSFVEISEENPSSTVSVNGGRCQPIDSITFFEKACNAPRSELSYVQWMTIHPDARNTGNVHSKLEIYHVNTNAAN
jgi:hypothetical protein